jgi:hypothetical protein
LEVIAIANKNPLSYRCCAPSEGYFPEKQFDEREKIASSNIKESLSLAEVDLRTAWEKLTGLLHAWSARGFWNQQEGSWSADDSCRYTKRNGAYGIRTRDLLNAIEALYQLS